MPLTISPEQVPLYAPGEILAQSDNGDPRRRVVFREFRYGPLFVEGPAIDSLLIVVYRHGQSRMRRLCEDGWKDALVRPRMISILGTGTPSRWEWDQPIEVSHLYLSSELLSETCASAFEQDYRRLNAKDALEVDDGKLLALADVLIDELRVPSAGGTLLIDTLAQALSVRLLRDYHQDRKQKSAPAWQLTAAQKLRALDFIEAHLSRDFDLEQLAREAGISEYHFIRCFKVSFGLSPHQFVIRKRLDRALEMIRTSPAPLSEVAVLCGFSDQSHMTRAFRRILKTTPGVIRSSAKSQ
ncbi:AraC family transcriptional regulator [Bradyrhizobium frederickii]|uniref:AraC family transcriptional regulator n=1 Tax=Bradyrhizobium frederickii TaxID=2560054 RepID=A0A4Y9NLU6_9BRAD|nr:AraC family transcriptional regulator [Bradyrhizobium frederickii]TFV68860.1 AraC family transcriptional regulator [Bradyrhizobium frederickii]